MQSSGHSPCNFMHDLCVAEICIPAAVFLPLIVWIYLHSIPHIKLWKEDHKRQGIIYQGKGWCVTVIQGHRKWYQSEDRMRFPISFPL